MKRRMKLTQFILLNLAVSCSASVIAARSVSAAEPFEAFLAKHCVRRPLYTTLLFALYASLALPRVVREQKTFLSQVEFFINLPAISTLYSVS